MFQMTMWRLTEMILYAPRVPSESANNLGLRLMTITMSMVRWHLGLQPKNIYLVSQHRASVRVWQPISVGW